MTRTALGFASGFCLRHRLKSQHWIPREGVSPPC